MTLKIKHIIKNLKLAITMKFNLFKMLLHIPPGVYFMQF